MSRCSLFDHMEDILGVGTNAEQLRLLGLDNSMFSTVGKSVFGHRGFYMACLCIRSACRVRREASVEYILDWVEILDPMTALSSMRAYVLVLWPLSTLQDA